MATTQLYTALIWNYSEPVKALVRRESVKAFDSFVIVWNEYKKSSDFQTCPDEIKSAINELIYNIQSIDDEE